MTTLIGIVGDRDPGNRTHQATEAALGHLAQPAVIEIAQIDHVDGHNQSLAQRMICAGDSG